MTYSTIHLFTAIANAVDICTGFQDKICVVYCQFLHCSLLLPLLSPIFDLAFSCSDRVVECGVYITILILNSFLYTLPVSLLNETDGFEESDKRN